MSWTATCCWRTQSGSSSTCSWEGCCLLLSQGTRQCGGYMRSNTVTYKTNTPNGIRLPYGIARLPRPACTCQAECAGLCRPSCLVYVWDGLSDAARCHSHLAQTNPLPHYPTATAHVRDIHCCPPCTAKSSGSWKDQISGQCCWVLRSPTHQTSFFHTL